MPPKFRSEITDLRDQDPEKHLPLVLHEDRGVKTPETDDLSLRRVVDNDWAGAGNTAHLLVDPSLVSLDPVTTVCPEGSGGSDLDFGSGT